MEIKIKGNLLNNAPLNSNFSKILCENYEEKLDRITDEIKYGAHKNYLVTGYRGVGKTSIIQRLKQKINNSRDIEDKVIFLELNLFDSHDHIYILKNMIRKLYLALNLNFKETNHDENIKKIIQKSKNLYIQTFVEVSKGFGKENTIQKSTEIELEVFLKNLFKIILVSALFFLPVNISNKLGNLASKFFLKIPISLFLLFPLLKNIKIKKLKSKIESKNSSFDFKEILDEDTYDYYLKEILKDLSKNKIKVIIILDELDKIKNINKIETIFDNLKSVMLSNLATFIVIPGQELFYRLNELRLEDNSYLDSLFSKNIHISTLNKDTYETVFKALLVDEKNLEKIEVKEYLDNMYINSFGIIRKFFQNLNKEIIWEKKESYINVKREYRDTSNSKILECFDEIYENIISYNFPEPLEEYHKIQLYIWINKMKEKISFTSEDILTLEKLDKSRLEQTILNMNLKLLFDKLVKENVLEKKGDEAKYYWKNSIDIKDEGIDVQIQVSNNFLNGFINLEKIIRKTYSSLYPNERREEKNLRKILMSFYENPDFILSIDLKEIFDLISYRNKVVHGDEDENEDEDIRNKNLLIKAKRINVLIQMFLEDYFYMLFTKNIIINDWSISKNRFHVDIVLEKQNKYILLELKYISALNENSIPRIKTIINKFITKQLNKDIKNRDVLLIILIDRTIPPHILRKWEEYSISIDKRVITKFLKIDNINNIDEIKHHLDSIKNNTETSKLLIENLQNR